MWSKKHPVLYIAGFVFTMYWVVELMLWCMHTTGV